MAKFVIDYKKATRPILEEEKRLVALGLQMEREIKLSMKTGGGEAGAHSPVGAPPYVQTGRLRASISTNWSESSLPYGEVKGGKAQVEDGVRQPERMANQFTVVVGTNVEYAPWVEYGTKRMFGPHPFMRPIFDKFKSKYGR